MSGSFLRRCGTPGDLCAWALLALVVGLWTPAPIVAQPGPPARCRTANLAIPDNDPGGVTDSLVVSGSGSAVSSLELYIDLTHSFVGDLRLLLTHVDTGTSAVVVDRPLRAGSGFGCSGNDMDLTLADGEALTIEDDCTNVTASPAYLTNGRYRPGDPPADLMASFGGESLDGTWTLNVSDNAGFDTGILGSWCLDPGAPMEADLSLTKSGTLELDDTITYEIEVANAGPANASGVMVTDPLDPCVVYLSDDCGGTDVPPWTWAVGALAAGASATCTVSVDAAGCAGSVVNSAAITAFDQIDPNPGNESDSVSLLVGVAIPTLDRAGLLLLLIAMALGALVLLRRRA